MAMSRHPQSALFKPAANASMQQRRQQLAPIVTSAENPEDPHGERLIWNCKQPRELFEATEVLPRLFLGSYLDADSAAELEKRNIKRIVNVAKECQISSSVSCCQEFQIKKYDITDHSDEDITALFNDAIEFIHDGILSGEGVLVHCRQGVSRSATIVLAYLMRFGVADFCCPEALSQHPSPMEENFPDSPTAHAGPSSVLPVTFDHPDSTPVCSNETVGSAESDATRISTCSASSILTSEQAKHQAVCLSEGLRNGFGCSCCKGHGMCYLAAFDFVKTKRPHISPNLGFVLALHEIDRKRGLGVPVA